MPSPTPSPLPIYTPTAPPYKPTGVQLELFQYMLALINKDRQDFGLAPVTLAYNAAAQKHAQDMLDNYYISHWATDGLKPYMRYTLEGGLNFERENDAYSGWFNRAENPANYAPIDPKEEINALEYAMMYDDAASDWGHRDTILYEWNKRVSLGIAYDNKRLALVQQFEGDYIEYTVPPTLSGNTLSLGGRFTGPSIVLDNVSIAYEALPQPLTAEQLLAGPHNYNLGERLNFIIPPPPPGQFYVGLPPEAIQAKTWELDQAGRFSIQADIAPSLAKGKGVYTVVIVVKMGNEAVNLTNYSIFVK
ncbi:MAG: CAP domain-containing protein [Chloroflexi bacterium]|nr:CAP domain-containing protein [Chloroflexota bacterium]